MKRLLRLALALVIASIVVSFAAVAFMVPE
jgi:multisubunit Na+/H+ antiporter MnhC subunit